VPAACVARSAGEFEIASGQFVTTRVEERIAVAAPPEAVWEAVTDWERGSRWVALTTITVEAPEDRQATEHGVGERFTAVTGLFGVGVADHMEVTRWEPPRRVDVAHLGRVVRGTGTYLVEPAPGGAWFVWIEELELPLGRLGRLGFPLVRPLFRLLLRRSLRTLARRVEAGW
jgi:carbon monoxide dehydrogenase subunit G